MSSVIVVEGIHDQMIIERIYPQANVVITNGSEIAGETIEFLKVLSSTHDIIIFTDPDTPGEKIRNKIAKAIPTAKHGFLRKKDAISKNHKKVGIEHASIACIKESLDHLITDFKTPNTIHLKDLYDLKLLGMPNSGLLRDAISEKLNIGKPNGKTFLKRVNMLRMSREELELLCQKLEL